jgi:hypothetical protein
VDVGRCASGADNGASSILLLRELQFTKVDANRMDPCGMAGKRPDAADDTAAFLRRQ